MDSSELNLVALVEWQRDYCNRLIMQGILEGRDMTDPMEVKRVTDFVAEQTIVEFGIG